MEIKNWTLAFTHPESGAAVRMAATVPGNVELDLHREGLLGEYWPADSTEATRVWELVDDWTYETTFDAPALKAGERAELVFEGIDTIADIYLNGAKMLTVKSMFVAHRLDVTEGMRERGNALKVVIRSSEIYAQRQEYDAFAASRSGTDYKSQTYLRKARHEWGWDNAPRLRTSGIWRSVHLDVVPAVRLADVYLYTQLVGAETCSIGMDWRLITPETDLRGYVGEWTLSREGKTLLRKSFAVEFPAGSVQATCQRSEVALWWPKGYGEAALYEARVTIGKSGAPLAQWEGKMGIRTIECQRSEHIDAHGQGEFLFVVNGEPVYINGTNWKPLDALHSRAEERVERALMLADDLHCNMIRVWGGGVYEDHRFFEICDERGMMVWQDFMFACEFPPRDEWFLRDVFAESCQIVKKLRNHPSLAIWCGDNEDDMTFTWGTMIARGIRPSDNLITRKVLKEALLRYDPHRAYVESSPYVSDALAEKRFTREQDLLATPEAHLYPPTRQFAQALRDCRARFIGETGPIIVNAMTDNEAIFAKERARAERLWDAPIPDAERNLTMHQRDDYFMSWRQVGRELCEHYFGRDFSVAEWKDYAFAINIVCGGVFKDAIEYSRSLKFQKTGVLWWSLLDMWPMLFNYSVVDYDFHKKMPYYWIRQSQQSLCLVAVRRVLGGERVLAAVNDTLRRLSGEYKIYAIADGRPVLRGAYAVEANARADIALLPESEPGVYVIEWTEDGVARYNHFTVEALPQDFANLRGQMEKLLALYTKE